MEPEGGVMRTTALRRWVEPPDVVARASAVGSLFFLWVVFCLYMKETLHPF